MSLCSGMAECVAKDSTIWWFDERCEIRGGRPDDRAEGGSGGVNSRWRLLDGGISFGGGGSFIEASSFSMSLQETIISLRIIVFSGINVPQAAC